MKPNHKKRTAGTLRNYEQTLSISCRNSNGREKNSSEIDLKPLIDRDEEGIWQIFERIQNILLRKFDGKLESENVEKKASSWKSVPEYNENIK